MDYTRYAVLRKKIVPQLRFSQSIYEDVVTDAVADDTVWLDAGCGWHVLPEWRREAEECLVSRARLALGCDRRARTKTAV